MINLKVGNLWLILKNSVRTPSLDKADFIEGLFFFDLVQASCLLSQVHTASDAKVDF